jgi:hypothetical protein
LTREPLGDKVTQVSRVWRSFSKNHTSQNTREEARLLPSVFVVPVYVEVSSGFERAVDTLESHLRRAGYLFHTGEPLPRTLEETKRALGLGNGRETRGDNGGIRAQLSARTLV